MIKTTTPDTQDGLVNSGAPLVQFIPQNGITKSASECFPRSKMADFKPDDDHFMQHLIAMGAHEKYGWNRNGDTFTRDELRNTHDTFCKHAHLYREHRNTCPITLGIGIVKASAYNPKMDWVELIVHGDKRKAEKEYEMAKAGKELSYSMSCFPAGTPVRKGDGSHVPIETIQPGDEVLTHKGRIQKVSRVMERDYSGPAVRMRPYGLPYDVLSTADHGIWARRRAKHIHSCPVCGGVFKNLKRHMQQGDVKHQSAVKDLERYAEGFTAAANLRPGDLVRQPVDATVAPGKASRSLAIVAGYYAAEGSLCVIRQKYTSRVTGEVKTCPDHRIEFTFNITEADYIAELQGAVEALGYPRPSTHDYPEENRTVVRSHSKELYAWLLLNCGKYSHRKVLSREVMTWEPEFQKVLLEKWIEGDGTFAAIGNGKLSATTVSEAMAWQMVDIAARNGLVAGMWTSPGEMHVTRGRKRPYYVSITGNSARGLDLVKFPDTHPVPVGKVCSSSHLKHQSETATSVHALSKPLCFFENGYIYRQLRKVTHETLQATVYDFTVPGDHGFMVAGVGVSNCKIAGDRCSCCDHFARRTTDYCDHAANHLGQYIPQFKKYAFVFNPNPRFFDISIVGKPADRLAHYIQYRFADDQQKAASEGGNVIGGAAWAEFYGMRDETNLRNYLDRIDTEVSDFSKLSNFTGINAYRSPGQLNDRQLTLLRSRDLSTVLKTFHKRASLLPFESFVSLVGGRDVDSIVRDSDYAAALSDLHAGRLKQACADSLDLESSLCGEGNGETDVVDEVLDAVDNGLSCKVQKGEATFRDIVSKVASAEASSWAAVYGVYKAAALRDMLECGAITELEIPMLALRF